MGVGFDLLGDGNGLARMEGAIEVKREGIGRVWQEIEGVLEDEGYGMEGMGRIMERRNGNEKYGHEL